MAKPHFTPRRHECPLCNAIMMMIWNLKIDVRCNACHRKFYAPRHNSQQRTDPSALNDAEPDSIINRVDEFQMSCTNAWCSFCIVIKAKDPQREEKLERFRLHKTKCKNMYDHGKRYEKTEANGKEIYVDIQKYGLTKEVEFAMAQEQALAEKDKRDQETDKEVTDSSRNSDDSERGYSDSDDDMTTN